MTLSNNSQKFFLHRTFPSDYFTCLRPLKKPTAFRMSCPTKIASSQANHGRRLKTSWPAPNRPYGSRFQRSTRTLGSPLPHFPPFSTPDSTGVSVFAQDMSPYQNAHVFPPLLRFLDAASFSLTTLVPRLNPLFWPLIHTKAFHSVILSRKGDHDILLFPSPQNVFLTRLLSWDLLRLLGLFILLLCFIPPS